MFVPRKNFQVNAGKDCRLCVERKGMNGQFN